MLPSALIDASDIVCLPREELGDLVVGHADLVALLDALAHLAGGAARLVGRRHYGIHREIDSITQAGFSLPSISMVMSTLVWMPPPLRR